MIPTIDPTFIQLLDLSASAAKRFKKVTNNIKSGDIPKAAKTYALLSSDLGKIEKLFESYDIDLFGKSDA